MNQRIKQLAEQAEQYADDTMNADPATYDTPGQMKVWQELMQEKFAELIVAECINMIEADAKKADEDDVHGMRNAAGLIGRAFITLRGVEE